MPTDTLEHTGHFSSACYIIRFEEIGVGALCGPAFYTPDPIDPELFDDRGPARQLLAGDMPIHDVYISPPQTDSDDDEDEDGDARHPQPVHMLAWEVLGGVLFFASGRPPISCR